MESANQRSQPVNKFVRDLLRQEENLLAELYRENFDRVEAYVLKNSGNGEDARDIFQEAFLAVWRNIQLDKFQPATRQEFAAYLYQVSKFKWIDQLRARRVRPIATMELPDLSADEAAQINPEEAEQVRQVREKFSELGTNCRELLKRFYFQKQRLQDIARHFNWTEPTAKNNKYRCLQQLRTLLRGQSKKDIQ